jgi:hypothetical protein
MSLSTMSLPTMSLPTVSVPVAASAALGDPGSFAFSEVRGARRERTLMGVAALLAGVAIFVALIAIAIVVA